MTYALLNTIVLGLCLWFVVVAVVLRNRRSTIFTPAVFKAMLITGGIMLVTTAIFDIIMIGVGMVGYDTDTLMGIYIGNAPIEDFAYTVAAVMILPTVWILLGGRKEKK